MGNQNTRKKTCPIATLSVAYPIRSELRLKLSLRYKRSATHCLSHDTELLQLRNNSVFSCDRGLINISRVHMDRHFKGSENYITEGYEG